MRRRNLQKNPDTAAKGKQTVDKLWDMPRALTTAEDGLVLVDKPSGITSHDVVNKMRRLTATRKVGHAGTLDPLATGLLVIGVGKATRLMHYLLGADKTYTATIRLGQTTVSDDSQGEVLETQGSAGIQIDAIDAAIGQLTGNIQQIPSTVSAKKIAGQRAYDLARAGIDVELAPVPVIIYEFVRTSEPVTQVEGGVKVCEFTVRVQCSTGTYVRALARDLGQMLGCGAHLRQLRRTAIGSFSVDQARTLLQLKAEIEAANVLSNPPGLSLLELSEACRFFPHLELDATAATLVAHGGQLSRANYPAVPPVTSFFKSGSVAERTGQDTEHGDKVAPVVAAFHGGTVIALLTAKSALWQPAVVFYPA